MYLPIPTQKTCAAAWLEATKHVTGKPKHEAHNVIIDIATPLVQTTNDKEIIEAADKFLHEHDRQAIQTVANTIFPEELYCAYGAPNFIEKFHKDILPKIRKRDRWSGYYFERMTAVPVQDGKPINMLWDIVERIRSESNKSLNRFEISIFDPQRDIDNSPYGGQCLSFLSFKLTSGTQRKKLMLTAMYRNHYYIEKLLGNVIGLARLISFVSREAGVDAGELTVVSTHAVVDTPNKAKRSDVNSLIERCTSIAGASEAA